MTWRPTKYLLEGELDNTTPGKVTGWMRFAGMYDKVTFDLEGDFRPDIRGAKIVLTNEYHGGGDEATDYMRGFVEHQTGRVGNMTAGLPPQDYTDYPFIEWYGDRNDRVVMYPESDQVKVVRPPVSRSKAGGENGGAAGTPAARSTVSRAT